jgi:hypothetical protein
MAENNSAPAVKFGFGKPNAGDDKQNSIQSSSPVEEVNANPEGSNTQEQNSAKGYTVQETRDAKNDAPYTDKRSITIALVRNYSKYREANRAALPKRVDYIGSSVTSSKVLSSFTPEIEKYFPRIIGISTNDPNFIARVKQYLNNIQVKVDELGKTFDISFRYNKYSDYVIIAKKEEAIENEYKLTNRTNIANLASALKLKIQRLNELEQSKCYVGEPVNVEDYLIYRHCLLYGDIAKDEALINSDASVRFYFKDDQKEADKLKKLRQEVIRAKANYVAATGDDSLFDAIYVQYCVLNNVPVASALLASRIEKEIKLDQFSQADPAKFNRIFNNKDIKLISMIEHLIARGELIRSQYNQNIATVEGMFIGANMLEAIAWFKNPDNTSAIEVYKNKLHHI